MAPKKRPGAAPAAPSTSVLTTSRITAVRVPKAAELVADQLRTQIVRGELTSGESLPAEATLIEQFGVSRPTLREAFRILESESLVTIRRGSLGGAWVHQPDANVAARFAGQLLQSRGVTLADVLVARAIIEPPCAGLLARNRTARDLKILRAAVEEADAAVEDPVKSIQLQQDFHALVVELSGNGTMQMLVGMVRNIIDTALITKVEREADTPSQREATHTGHRSHRRLLEHIENRDADAAERLWRKHIDETTKYLMKDSDGVVEILR